MTFRNFTFAAAAPLMVVAVVACSSSTPTPTPDEIAIDVCSVGAPRPYDVDAYELDGRYDWSAHKLVATVTVTLTPAEDGLASVVLDSRVTDVVSVKGPSGAAIPFVHAPTKGSLRIDTRSLALKASTPVALTIAYEAATAPNALGESHGRDGDPVTTRAVYTQSEPTFGAYWMPANHRPSDRARFAVSLTVASTDDVIGNGERTDDAPTASGERHVRYATDYPIPTYLMAFAAGELVHEDGVAAPGETPVALWHRRGVPIDSAGNLAFMRAQVNAFEGLMGKYPFGHYAVVLLPEFPGGMENASITFNTETSGQGALTGLLNAHELGHQWFGDAVTVRTWDDVWIKEGMATLLEGEGDRVDLTGAAFTDFKGTIETAASPRLLGENIGASAEGCNP